MRILLDVIFFGSCVVAGLLMPIPVALGWGLGMVTSGLYLALKLNVPPGRSS